MEEKLKELRKTGTTTVGIVCDGAVVLGAERQSTMGYLVSAKHAKKIMQVDDHIGMTIAGMEGDAQALDRFIKAELKLYKLQEERRIDVKVAATLIANILYSRRTFPYIVQLVVGGYDNTPKLFSFDPIGATQEEKEYFSTGSGSPIAFGVLENKFKSGMSLNDAKKLVVNAIKAAIERDIASGGKGIDLAVIDSKGFRAVSEDEIKNLAK